MMTETLSTALRNHPRALGAVFGVTTLLATSGAAAACAYASMRGP